MATEWSTIMGAAARAPKGLTRLLPPAPKKAAKLKLAPEPVAAPLSPVDKLAAIEAIPQEYVDCRDTGHNWRRFGAVWNEQDHHYEQTFRCRGCSTLKHRFLNIRGDIIDYDYTYSDGYTMPKGMGFLSSEDRSIVRLRAALTLGNDDA